MSVDAGTTRYVDFYADAGGLTAGTMNLYMYKLNASTNEWELQENIENWYVVVLGGVSDHVQRTLAEGEWLFVLGNGEGLSLATGYTLRFDADVVNDYNNALTVEGTITGNVIEDLDNQNGQDDLPVGTTVTSITNADGLVTNLIAGEPNTLVGKYGTLTVNSDGSFSYVVNSTFRDYGEVDRFIYEVTAPSGKTTTANLNIELASVASSDEVIIDNTVVLAVQPTETTLIEDQITIGDATAVNILSLGIAGDVLSAGVVGTEGVMDFTVAEGTTRELTFQGSGGGLSLAVTYEFTLYRQDEQTGQFVQVHKDPDFLFVPLLASGTSDPLALTFGEGVYVAIINATGGIDVAGGATVEVTEDKTYDYNTPLTLTGTTTGDATTEATDAVVEVNDIAVVDGQPATIIGEFGTLVINYDGTYTYSVNKPADTTGWVPPYGEVDRFEVVRQTAEGNSVIDILNIKIETNEAVDDQDQGTIDLLNSTPFSASADVGAIDISASRTISFDVEGNNYLNSLTLEGVVTRSSVLSSPTMNVSITKDGGATPIYNGPVTLTWTTLGTSSNYSLNMTLLDGQVFDAGAYVVNITTASGLGNIVDVDSATLTGSLINDISNVTSPVIEGNVLTNDSVIGQIDILKIGHKEVYVNDVNKGADSITVEGEHGVLTLYRDGKYSYQPNGLTGGVDTFTYNTVTKVGTEQTATLEINVGLNITGTGTADEVNTSASIDLLTLGAGADTAIFDVLNQAQHIGQADVWTDYSQVQGDVIDISALLAGQTVDSGNIGTFVTLAQDGTDTVVSIDLDGTGTQYNPTELVTLQNTDSTTLLLEELLKYNNPI